MLKKKRPASSQESSAPKRRPIAATPSIKELIAAKVLPLSSQTFMPEGYDQVACLACSPCGRQLAVGGYQDEDFVLSIVDVVCGVVVRELFRNPRLKASFITIMKWSPCGDRIAFVYDTRVFIVSSVEKGQLLRSLPIPMSVDVSWSPDGQNLAFVGERRFGVWSLSKQSVTVESRRDTNWPILIEWHPRLKRLVLASRFGSVFIRSSTTGKLMSSYSCGEKPSFLKWSRCGTKFTCISRGPHNSIRFAYAKTFDIYEDRLTQIPLNVGPYSNNCDILSPCGAVVLTTRALDGYFSVWSIEDGSCLGRLPVSDHTLPSKCKSVWSDAGSFIASCYPEGITILSM